MYSIVERLKYEIQYVNLLSQKIDIDIFPGIHHSMNNMIKYVLIDKSINLKPIRSHTKMIAYF